MDKETIMVTVVCIGVALFFLFSSFSEGVRDNGTGAEQVANRINLTKKLNQETYNRQSEITAGIDELQTEITTGINELQRSADRIEESVRGTGDSLEELLASIERCEQLIRTIQQRAEKQDANN